jgi:hypothetical protein
MVGLRSRKAALNAGEGREKCLTFYLSMEITESLC